MAENDDATRGPLPPYGPAIWDAVKRGDLHEMEHVANQARLAIARGAQEAGVHIADAGSHFRDVAAHEVVEVREALTHLENKISELRTARGGGAGSGGGSASGGGESSGGQSSSGGGPGASGGSSA